MSARRALDDARSLLGAYPSSTVMGISVLAGSLTGWLLEQLTWRQALAASVSGLVAVLVKQAGAGAVVTGPVQQLVTDAATLMPPPGSTTTVRTP